MEGNDGGIIPPFTGKRLLEEIDCEEQIRIN